MSDAKQAIFDYCKKRGALAVGIASLEACERIAPARAPAERPLPAGEIGDLARRRRPDQGTWQMPAKAMAYSGSTEVRAYKRAYGLAFFIEQKFGAPRSTCRRTSTRKAGRACRCRA
jgi:hypothetical protein